MKQEKIFKYVQGEITQSGNFELDRQITNLNEFYAVITSHKSIFARHRMYPAAFFFSWQMREVKKWIDARWFWTTLKIEKTKCDEKSNSANFNS
jgi:hypothetical protein